MLPYELPSVLGALCPHILTLPKYQRMGYIYIIIYIYIWLLYSWTLRVPLGCISICTVMIPGPFWPEGPGAHMSYGQEWNLLSPEDVDPTLLHK